MQGGHRAGLVCLGAVLSRRSKGSTGTRSADSLRMVWAVLSSPQRSVTVRLLCPTGVPAYGKPTEMDRNLCAGCRGLDGIPVESGLPAALILLPQPLMSAPAVPCALSRLCPVPCALCLCPGCAVPCLCCALSRLRPCPAFIPVPALSLSLLCPVPAVSLSLSWLCPCPCCALSLPCAVRAVRGARGAVRSSHCPGCPRPSSSPLLSV